MVSADRSIVAKPNLRSILIPKEIVDNYMAATDKLKKEKEKENAIVITRGSCVSFKS